MSYSTASNMNFFSTNEKRLFPAGPSIKISNVNFDVYQTAQPQPVNTAVAVQYRCPSQSMAMSADMVQNAINAKYNALMMQNVREMPTMSSITTIKYDKEDKGGYTDGVSVSPNRDAINFRTVFDARKHSRLLDDAVIRRAQQMANEDLKLKQHMIKSGAYRSDPNGSVYLMK